MAPQQAGELPALVEVPVEVNEVATPRSPVDLDFASREIGADDDYRYDAFISYRHVEPDRAWARWLHSALETYRTPKYLVRQRRIAPRLQRAFRDEEELPASADLSQEIDTALRQSRFLIVICSPRAPESLWVNREVELFRQLGRHDRILALLIEGEPAKSFPQALRSIRKKIVDGSGMTRDQVEEVEPLAADVRADRGRRMGQLKHMARLRLMACILGVRFDDLKQRDRIRARWRLGVIGTVAASLVMVLLIAGYRAWRSDADAAQQRQLAKLSEEQKIIAEAKSGESQKQRLAAEDLARETEKKRLAAEDLARETDKKRVEAEALANAEKAKADDADQRAKQQAEQAKLTVDQLKETATAKENALKARLGFMDASETAREAAADTEAPNLWSEVQTLASQAQVRYDAQDFPQAQTLWEQSNAKAVHLSEVLGRIHAAAKGYNDALSKLDVARLDTFGGNDWNSVKNAVKRAKSAGTDDVMAAKEYTAATNLLGTAWKTADAAFKKANDPVIARKVADHLAKARDLEAKSQFIQAYDEVGQALALNSTDKSAIALRTGILAEDTEDTIYLEKQLPQVKFNSTRLSDAVDFMRDISGANIYVDWKTLQAAGVAKDTPVNAAVVNVTLDKLLKLICSAISPAGHAIAFDVQSGAIVVSTQESFDRNTITRSYDVGNLAQTQQEVDQLCKVIMDIDATTWKDNGGNIGSINAIGHQLVITQCKRVHKMIAASLDALQKAKK